MPELFDVLTTDYDIVENVLDIPATWTGINNLAVPARADGAYLITFSIIWQFPDSNDSVFFRFRENSDPWVQIQQEPRDTSDVIPFTYVLPYIKSDQGAAMTIEVEAMKESGNNDFDVIVSNVLIQRIGD